LIEGRIYLEKKAEASKVRRQNLNNNNVKWGGKKNQIKRIKKNRGFSALVYFSEKGIR
jgi:hypothetical protein